MLGVPSGEGDGGLPIGMFDKKLSSVLAGAGISMLSAAWLLGSLCGIVRPINAEMPELVV